MTLPQFLSQLRKTPRDWYITRDGEIRRIYLWGGRHKYKNIECPITALDHKVNDLWRNVAKHIGMDIAIARKIAMAADSEQPCVLRRKLLRACGLKDAS